MKLRPDQKDAVDFICGGDHTFLIAPTGAGKTTIILHAIAAYKRIGDIRQAIVAAPASVIDHWPREAEKWAVPLTVTALTGSPTQRLKALSGPSDVLVVSLNNLAWLLDQKPMADMIVIDELSKAAGKQTAKLKQKHWVQQLSIRVGMTATPVSENFENLYGMLRIIDNGEALGTRKDAYMSRYFEQLDFMGYKHGLQPDGGERIMAAIKPILHVVASTKATDLPPVHHTALMFAMPPETREAYKQLQTDLLLGDIVADNAAVLSGKLRQVASGFAMTEDGEVLDFDDARAGMALVWVRALKGRKGIILYQFNYQREQLKKALADFETVSVYGGCDKPAALAEFYAGAQILIAQQATLSHGVDGLQHVCSEMLFYQPVWSKDTAEQAEGRLYRTGQTEPVTITTLICSNSIDGLVVDRLKDKSQFMDKFIAHLTDK